MADGLPGDLGPEAAPLGAIQAPLGKWFITGNHEYYSDALGWMRVAEGVGFTPLINQHVLLERAGGRLLLAGVPDPQGRRFFANHESRPDLAVAGAPSADFKLLLAHQPSSAIAADAAGFDLMLSGHTHGGQYLPFNWIAGKANLYLKGLNRHSERLRVYVNQGTGFWGPPIRVGTAPEITLLTLRRL
jgi:predicted MPP superfamily phosphohydrolase